MEGTSWIREKGKQIDFQHCWPVILQLSCPLKDQMTQRWCFCCLIFKYLIYKGTSYLLIYINDDNMDVWGGDEGLVAMWSWRLLIKLSSWLACIWWKSHDFGPYNVIPEHIFHMMVQSVFIWSHAVVFPW